MDNGLRDEIYKNINKLHINRNYGTVLKHFNKNKKDLEIQKKQLNFHSNL